MAHSLRVNYKSWGVVQKYVVSLHSCLTGGPHTCTMHKCLSSSFKVQSSQATPLSFSTSLPLSVLSPLSCRLPRSRRLFSKCRGRLTAREQLWPPTTTPLVEQEPLQVRPYSETSINVYWKFYIQSWLCSKFSLLPPFLPHSLTPPLPPSLQ